MQTRYKELEVSQRNSETKSIKRMTRHLSNKKNQEMKLNEKEEAKWNVKEEKK